jgi:FtsH-binding integral membrane protein
MTVKTEGGTDVLPDPVIAQSLTEDLARSAATPAAMSAPGTFTALREPTEPVRSEAAPHFIGALLFATPAGLISCVVALLFGRSLLEALAVYALIGAALFVGLLIVRSGTDDPDP